MKYKITETYKKLNSIRLGLQPFKDNKLTPGKITVSIKIKNDDETEEIINVEGTYNRTNGILSGLAKFYNMGLFEAEEGEYEIITSSDIEIKLDVKKSHKSIKEIEKEYKSIFEKKNLKHIHIEPFRPENLKNWTPNTEADIYMIFGVLEEFTDFKYCCGLNQSLLNQLNFKYDEDTNENQKSKPDCILIDKTTNEYLIGEFKMKSSDFISNHNKTDVDVVVVWVHDEKDDNKLPKHIVDLSVIAKTAAIENLND